MSSVSPLTAASPLFGFKFSPSMLLAFDSASDASPGDVASSFLGEVALALPASPAAFPSSSTGLLGSATTV